ncbi:tripartite tricarboxylate transporter substrate binding protein [Tardiphaga sp. vice352]|uniref:Bug family tripartite tricarboxylate transporter substrate binding protein n=1 Tax=unclassified Tardiphaga TaxID=2631404 RepID=UPI00116597D5|nr:MULTISPECIES: tripartite tricarboxylate transporter substrate binding protein [unclassified Tardiphaga]QDM15850.1 tripartite tricarboxylate transporter substrate binding protein [Tardiphaga sp. vice278]QDM20951.1 tripartite tricarboxylate transporter substrate binding protein [Tardiphaga sp. vice154]QDM31193.1 tripartite tricarboxylate transporter substrate binding protein [Tardiphaga sp. vice352]
MTPRSSQLTEAPDARARTRKSANPPTTASQWRTIMVFFGARYRNCLSRTLLTICASLTVGASAASAEDYPDRSLKIVQPFAAGGSTDVLARGLAQKLSEYLRQPVIVEARPGANGIIATQAVAKSPPDGYTILLTTGSFTANPQVASKPPYDVFKEFKPITQLAGSYGLALLTNLPANSVAELVSDAKKAAKPLSYATSGAGNLTHIAGRLFELRTGLDLTAVPYNTPAMLSDVMTGTVSMTFNSLFTAVPMVGQKQIKALAITGDRRSPALPDTPTMAEAGMKDYNLTGYFGILFPAGVPTDRVERIYRETMRALETPEVRKLIEENGLYVVGSSPDEFAAYIKQDFDYQKKLMDEVGLRPN